MTLIDAESAEQELEDGDKLEHMYEEIAIKTRLSGPQEPPSDQSTSRPSSTLAKGKAKMPEYEDDHFDNESTHSLDSEFGGFEEPIISQPESRKPSHRQMKNSIAPPMRRIRLADFATTTIWHTTIMPL